jgi:hypothetical protein
MVFLGQQKLVPRDRIELGRLVANPKKPWYDFYEPDLRIEFQKHAPLRTVHENYHSTVESSNDRTTTLLKWLLSRESRKLTKVQAAQSITYQLLHQKEVFKAICSIDDARAFLSSCLATGRKVYMIVGFHTFVDLTLESTLTKSTSTGASLSIGVPNPLSTSLGEVTERYEIRNSGRACLCCSTSQDHFRAVWQQAGLWKIV